MAEPNTPNFEEILKSIPGARRAAQGVIIPAGDGQYFHVTGVLDKKSTEGLSNSEMFYLAFCSRNEILRLRELRDRHDYLLYLRAKAIVDEARSCRVFRSRKQARSDWSLTKYYHSREGAKKEYLEQLMRANRKVLKKIPAGLGLARQANALCVRSFLGDVIFVSEALESFFYFMNLAFISRDWPITALDRASALAIATRVMLGSESLDFDIDTRGELPPELHREIQRKTDDQLAFTFGHEYAHHLCDHLSSASQVELNMTSQPTGNENASNESVVKYSHDIEFEADLVALQNVSSDINYQDRLCAAAISAFIFLDFLKPYFDMFQTRREGLMDTHPPPLDRLWRLRKKLKPNIGPSQTSIKEAIQAASDAHSALGHLIAEKGPNVLEFYGSFYLPSFKPKRGIDRIDY